MDADTAERAALDAKIGAVLRASADARATAAQARVSIDQLKFRVRMSALWVQGSPAAAWRAALLRAHNLALPSALQQPTSCTIPSLENICAYAY